MDTKKLNERWEKAITPDAHKLAGWYKVKILSGYGRVLGWFVKRWLKVLHQYNGNNCVDGKKEGHFLLHQHPEYVILNYNLPQNPEHWRRVLDYVRQESDGVLLGKLHVKFWDGWGAIEWFAGHRFQGFFTLTRIDEEEINHGLHLKTSPTRFSHV